ncbi:hypothetical protein BC628DRAFT_1371851 [Trametes gibbosa]|nr:hypothetical protein BC628DRAFT_1371851 [Trametes gibbosa]
MAYELEVEVEEEQEQERKNQGKADRTLTESTVQCPEMDVERANQSTLRLGELSCGTSVVEGWTLPQPARMPTPMSVDSGRSWSREMVSTLAGPCPRWGTDAVAGRSWTLEWSSVFGLRGTIGRGRTPRPSSSVQPRLPVGELDIAEGASDEWAIEPLGRVGGWWRGRKRGWGSGGG